MTDAILPIPVRKPALQHKCRACGKDFMAHSTAQVACSVDCKFAMYQNKGNSNDCWEWGGPLLGGYGLLFLDTNKANGRRNSTLAHRHSFMQIYGEIPAEKPCILHSCDNPKCTNPKHLRAGTRGENNAERKAKGRSGSKPYTPSERARYSEMFRGEKNAIAKLTEAQARAIKYDHKDLTAKQAAALYGVSTAAASLIRCNRNWRHI